MFQKIYLIIFLSRKALQFYRGAQYDISEEIEEMNEKHLSKLADRQSSSCCWTLKRFFSMGLRPFSCVGVLSILSLASGFNVVSIYMIEILQDSGSTINPNVAPIIVGTVRLVISSKLPILLVSFLKMPQIF